MAHFAELDENNVVLRVIVVANKNTSDANGVEKEYIGQAFCERLLGGRWVQTSYHANFRKNFAGPGCKYDPVLDAFIPPQPDPQCILDTETCTWNCPPKIPNDPNTYVWDDELKSWVVQS